jgi:hypothetical protein
MGGMIALEMARVFSDDPSVTVLGIVMIDTPLRRTAPNEQAVATGDLQGVVKTSNPELQKKILTMFRNSGIMIDAWLPPKWTKPDPGENVVSSDGQGRLHSNVRGSNGPPPAILLRATQSVPKNSAQPDIVARVDLTRGERSLGWNTYDGEFVRKIVDIEGNHFNIFEPDRVS